MTGKSSHENLSLIELHTRNKYWFIILPLTSLIAISIYFVFTPDQYKVSTTIVLPGNSLTVDDIKSKNFVQKTLDQLPFQVSYYHNGAFKRTEVYGDSLPIKLVFAKTGAVDTTAEVTAKILDDQLFEIRQNDTISSFFFNKPVDYPFAKFRGIKGPAFSKNAASIIIKFNHSDKQLQQYYDNLSVRSIGSDHKTARVSIIAATPEKGADFLNMLVSVLNKSDVHTAQSEPVIAPSILPVNTEKVKKRLAQLKTKEEKFKSELVKQQSIKQAPASYTTSTTHKNLSDLQDKILDAVQPYAKTSVNQFVQIPDSYQVDDRQLGNLIVIFNKRELDKQHILQDSQANRDKISGLNKEIAFLKTSILQKIDENKKGIIVVTSVRTPKSSEPAAYRNIQDSITKINSELNTAQSAYNEALQKSRPVTPARAVINSYITVIEKPADNISNYPNTGLVYFLTLLLGLTIPLAFPYLKHLNFSVNHKIDLKKISSRMDELTRVKEID